MPFGYAFPLEYFIKESGLNEDQSELIRDLIGNAMKEYAKALNTK